MRNSTMTEDDHPGEKELMLRTSRVQNEVQGNTDFMKYVEDPMDDDRWSSMIKKVEELLLVEILGEMRAESKERKRLGKSVAALSSKVQTMEGQLTRTMEGLQRLEEQQDSLEKRQSETEERVRRLTKKTEDEHESSTDKKLKELLDVIRSERGERIRLCQNVSSVYSKVQGVKAKFNRTMKGFQRLEERQNNLQKGQSETDERLGRVVDGVKDEKESGMITKVEQLLDVMKAERAEHKRLGKFVTSLCSEVQTMEDKINITMEGLHKLEERQRNLEKGQCRTDERVRCLAEEAEDKEASNMINRLQEVLDVMKVERGERIRVVKNVTSVCSKFQAVQDKLSRTVEGLQKSEGKKGKSGKEQPGTGEGYRRFKEEVDKRLGTMDFQSSDVS